MDRIDGINVNEQVAVRTDAPGSGVLGRVPKVAVIGVHGIARHPAGETENAMADLLLSLPKADRASDAAPGLPCGPCDGLEPDGERLYAPFKAVGIHIPLQRVRTRPVLKKTTGVASFKEQSALFSSYLSAELKSKVIRHRQRAADAVGADGAVQPPTGMARLLSAMKNQTQVVSPSTGTQTGNDYTSLLLDGYCGGSDGNTYITTRLEGMRHDSPRDRNAKVGSGKTGSGKLGTGKTGVDIYEVLWADLAHPDSSILGFFLSLFTWLMHLASLSQKAVDTGSVENSRALWSTFLWAQRMAVRILQIALPLFKVLMLIIFLSGIPGLSKLLAQPFAGELTNAGALAVALGILGAVGLLFGIYLKTKRIHWPLLRSPLLWSVFTIVPSLLGGALVYWIVIAFPHDQQFVASLMCWLCIGTPILAFILSKYEEWRNGVQFWGWSLYAIALATSVFLFLGFHRLGAAYEPWSHHDLALLTLWLTELGVAAIRFSWLALSLMAILALISGGLVCSFERNPEKKARLKAAVRTSRFALALPAVLFLLVTPLIWGAMFKLADWVHKPFFVMDGSQNDGNCLFHWLTCLHFIPDVKDPNFICGDYLSSILAWGIGYQLPITLILVTMAVLLLVWWVVPSALLETYPERDEKEPPRISTNDQTRALGSWLSRGLDATEVVTFLFWCSIFLAFPAVYAIGFVQSGPVHELVEKLKSITEWFVEHPVTALGGVLVAGLAKYGSSALETILDVDTYLRTGPVGATPRAKIFERFVSTLRYVAAYRDEQGRSYDSVVIVAHSLGSLIAADLLRYLYVGQSDPLRYDPGLERYGFSGESGQDRIELKLLTMGSPIRQLLQRFFPYLYDWVRPKPDNSLEPLAAALPPGAAPSIAIVTPSPAELGLSVWANTYRSGDYVGRELWLDEWYNRTSSLVADSGSYPEKIHVARSPSGDRVEMCIGAGAHTHYWDDTAPDVAKVLDEMI